MTTEEILREIKLELRANMNGVVSGQMRQAGANYHVNFGVELPRLQIIAQEFAPNHEVAQQLWHENVRESKILAGILMPTERFSPELCDLWLEQIPNAEIAQMTVMNLFARLPYATEKAFEWIASDREMWQLCGFLLMARLIIQGTILNDRSREELLDQAHSLQNVQNLHLRKAVQNVLIRIE